MYDEDDEDRVTTLDRVIVHLVAGFVRLRERPAPTAPVAAHAPLLGRRRGPASL